MLRVFIDAAAPLGGRPAYDTIARGAMLLAEEGGDADDLSLASPGDAPADRMPA